MINKLEFLTRLKPLFFILPILLILLLVLLVFNNVKPEPEIPPVGENLPLLETQEKEEIIESFNAQNVGAQIEYITPDLNEPLEMAGAKTPIVIKFNQTVDSSNFLFSSYPEKEFVLLNGFDSTQLVLRPETEWRAGSTTRISLYNNLQNGSQLLSEPIIFDIMVSEKVPELELPDFHND